MARRVKAGEERRNPINVRIRDVLRARLESAAELSSRSLSHEVEERLERSFDDQDLFMSMFGNEGNIAILRAIASSWQVVEAISGEPWNANSQNIIMAREAAANILDMIKPLDGSDPKEISGQGALAALGAPAKGNPLYRRELSQLAAMTAINLATGQDNTAVREHIFDIAEKFYMGVGDGPLRSTGKGADGALGSKA